MIDGNYDDTNNELYWVKESLLANKFPDVCNALRDPDGLLAIGGDLSGDRLLTAYRQGIFPWFNEGQPILWWSPDPRYVLEPGEIKISRSLSRCIRKGAYSITYNKVFAEVLEGCAARRRDTDETWITASIKSAYIALHKLGYAHSVECWHNNKLSGGLYGVAMGKIFFGESMFSRKSDASKLALVNLTNQLKGKGFRLIDCQIHSRHLQSLGAKPIKREVFIKMLNKYCNDLKTTDWQY